MTSRMQCRTAAPLFLHTVYILLFSGGWVIVLTKLLSSDLTYSETPDQGQSRQNFTDSSENGRLRPTSIPDSTPTPQPCLSPIYNFNLTENGNCFETEDPAGGRLYGQTFVSTWLKLETSENHPKVRDNSNNFSRLLFPTCF